MGRLRPPRRRGARPALLLCAVLGLAVATPAAAPAATARPDTVPPPVPARRVVSLAPSITGCLFAVGAGDRVVGVTRWCRLPAAAGLPRVGGILDPDWERILALRPDLVVVEAAHAEARRKLAALDLPVLAVEHRTLEGMLASLTRLGRACGTVARADSVRRALAARIAAVRRRAAAAPGEPPPVLVAVGVDDATGRVTTVHAAAAGTFLGELVTAAGGRPVPEGKVVRYPQLSVEGLLALAPAVILDLAPDCGDDPARLARRRAAWAALADLPAVRRGRVTVVTDPLAAVPGPNVVDTLERFAHAIADARR